MTIQSRAAPVCERAPGGPHAQAGVVELVDTPALGAGGRKPLGVRVPSPAFSGLLPRSLRAYAGRDVRLGRPRVEWAEDARAKAWWCHVEPEDEGPRSPSVASRCADLTA